MTDFLKESNLRLIWEVLMDEDILQSKPREFIERILTIFQQNLTPFYESEKKTNSLNLMALNKKYISLMIDVIQRLESQLLLKPLQPNLNTQKEAITYEEIQEEKKSRFEKDLVQKQQEFQRAVALPVPPTPSFGDPKEDDKPPISELEWRIQQTIKERNLDLDNRNYVKPDVQQASSWLNSQETSIKKDKLVPDTKLPGPSSKPPTTSIKYIKIEESLVKEELIQPISLDDYEKPSKNVQWSEKLEESYFVLPSPNTFLEEKESNLQLEKTLFSKLKRVPSLEKDVRIQQLEEEVKILYQKIDILTRVLEEKKLA